MADHVNRRAFMGGTAAVALSIAATDRRAQAGEPGTDVQVEGGFAQSAPDPDLPELPQLHGDYDFEIQRTEEEWRAMLTDEEYNILRRGSTDLPEAGELWKIFDSGTYHCRGCELRLYDSVWKVDVNMGWNFFRHAVPDTVMTGIDAPVEEYGQRMGGPDNMIEIHCRRCGSHQGHIVRVGRDPLHCINSTSLTFREVSA